MELDKVSSETRNDMHRLFVAIRPPAEIRARLHALQSGINGARWQDDNQLHLTLRFIGEADASTGNNIAEVLGDIRARPFEIALHGIGSFQRKGRIDTLWVGVTPHDPLTALHKKIDHALVRLGLPPEGRAYLPHFTIARLGRTAGPIGGFLAAHRWLSGADFRIEAFALYQSHLGDDGAAYDAVAHYPLE